MRYDCDRAAKPSILALECNSSQVAFDHACVHEEYRAISPELHSDKRMLLLNGPDFEDWHTCALHMFPSLAAGHDGTWSLGDRLGSLVEISVDSIP